MGSLPSSSATAAEDRDTTAKTQTASTSNAAGAQTKPASQAVKPKALPAVTVKAKAPQVMVKAKRKADNAEQSDLPPDKKQAQNGASESVETVTASGLAGLAAYGSDSDNSKASSA